MIRLTHFVAIDMKTRLFITDIRKISFASVGELSPERAEDVYKRQALICAPRFGIAFVWLAVPVGWLANFLISYVALRRSWPTDKMASIS